MKQLDTSSFAALERSGWTDPETAQSYASGFATASQFCVAPLVAGAGAGPGTETLDLCCGHGNVAQGLVAAGARVTALDFSPAMLELARQRAPEARFVEGDAMDLPFDNNAFDAVTMGFGILHIPDPTRALAEIGRVLRPGGRLAYTVWHDPSLPSALGYVFTAVAAHGDPGVSLPEGPGLHDYADPDFAYPRLTEAGFGDFGRQVVDCYWMADKPDAPVDAFLGGTVRGAALLRAQPAANLAAIREFVAGKVRAAHGATPPIRIPIPAVMVTAVAG